MPQIRATLFFFDAFGAGWTETIHNIGGDLTTVQGSAARLIPLRVRCLGSSANLYKARISDDLIQRDSLILDVPVGNQSNPLSTAASADANLCLVTRIEAGALKRRTLFMRGVPTNIAPTSGIYQPTPAFSTAFNNWKNQLLSDGWAVRSRGASGALATIVTISSIGAPTVLITTLAPHGLVLAQPIYITGVKGTTTVNGSWLVSSTPTATTFTIVSFQIGQPYISGGVVHDRTPGSYGLTVITDALDEDISKRGAGRPPFLPHGRRRGRLRR